MALVIGLSIHGVAVAGALAHCGIDVHALAQPARCRSAPAYTRYARVHFTEDLDSDQLVVHLQALARTIPYSTSIVLRPDEHVRKDLAESRNSLRRDLNISDPIFAYPYGG